METILMLGNSNICSYPKMGVQIFAHTPKWNSDVCSHPKMGGLAWEGAAVARPWPGLQMPGLCNTRSTSSRKACIPDVYVGYIEKGEFGSNSAVESYDTCSTPVLSLALVSTKIMLYLPRWMLHGEKENWCLEEEEKLGNLSALFHIMVFKNNLSAQSFASCTPTFRRPPRSHLLPTYNLENYFVANL